MRESARLVELSKLDESLVVEDDLKTSLPTSGYLPERTRTLYQGNAGFDCLRTDDAVKLWDREYPFAAVKKKLKSGESAFAVHRISAGKQNHKCCFWEVIKKGEDIFCFRSPKACGRFLTSRWYKGKKSFYLAAVDPSETLQDFWRLKQIARTGYVTMDFVFQNVHWREHEMRVVIERFGTFGPVRYLESTHGSEDACSRGSSMLDCGSPGGSNWHKSRICELETENYALESENERLKYELKMLKQQQCQDAKVSGTRASPLREVQHQDKVFPDDRENSTQTCPNDQAEHEGAAGGVESKLKHRCSQLDEREEKLAAALSDLRTLEEDLKRKLTIFNARLQEADVFESQLIKREQQVAKREACINDWKELVAEEVDALKSGLKEAANQFEARFHSERHAFTKIVLDAYRDDKRKQEVMSQKSFAQVHGERIMKEVSSLQYAFHKTRLEVQSSMQASESMLSKTKSSLLHVAENADAKNAHVRQLAGKLSKVQDDFKDCHMHLSEEFQARLDHSMRPVCELKSKLDECVLAQASKDKAIREKCTHAADSLREVREDAKLIRQDVASEINNIRGYLKGMAQALGEKATNLELERQKFVEECKKSQKAFQMKAEAIAVEVGKMKAANHQLREDFMLESQTCQRMAQDFIKEAVKQTVVEQRKQLKAELAGPQSEVKKLSAEFRELKSYLIAQKDWLRQGLDEAWQRQETICIHVATQNTTIGEEECIALVFDKWKGVVVSEGQENTVEDNAEVAECGDLLDGK